MTITVMLHSASHEYLCDPRMCWVWKFDCGSYWELFQFQFNSRAVELFAACTEGVFLTDAAMCMNLIVFARKATSCVIF